MKRYFSIFFILLLQACSQEDNPSRLHIYGWYNLIPQEMLTAFEKEFNITVVYDVYDSNDVLEAKLLTGHSGYDVVFPSTYPYLARQLKAHVYARLDKTKIPNLNLVDPELLKLMEELHGLDYAVPFLWSITVIGYRADLVRKFYPQASLHSLKMLYDLETVKKLSKCRLTYLEEPIDILPMALHYLGFPPHSSDKTHLERATTLLKMLRPYVAQFAASRPVEDLATGDVCVVQNWLGNILQIQHTTQRMVPPPDIQFSIPEEGTSMWLDALGIPADAPHKDNAHVFINFLLRPENMARLTNQTFLQNAVPASDPFIQDSIRKALTLTPEQRKKIFHPVFTQKQHIKDLTRAFQNIISGG